MAVGLPVVATHISGIPELVEHDRTGLLVSPGHPDKLAEAMLRMLTDVELRNRVRVEGKKRVVRKFDNRQLIRELADIYRLEGLGPGA
jgi:glycosyltransferase involved in cell wall biosynthesis